MLIVVFCGTVQMDGVCASNDVIPTYQIARCRNPEDHNERKNI
jgi:hypothetical protein